MTRSDARPPQTIDELVEALASRDYFADRGLATVLHVSLRLGKAVLLEGETGVGKTEVAKTLADVLGARLIRLQCHEGIDVTQALYDWDFARQMLYLRAVEATSGPARTEAAIDTLFGPRFLIRRPLLDAIDHDDAVPPVLLVDEIDRADDEFEAFLLELLSDFQITIPEIGTMRAAARPMVVMTSNRTRDLHDALKRRCLYHWIGYPELEREVAIVRARAPGVPELLAAQAVGFVQRVRAMGLTKVPGVAETIDWAQTLMVLGERELIISAVDASLGSLLKEPDDLDRVRGDLDALLAAARTVAQGALST